MLRVVGEGERDKKGEGWMESASKARLPLDQLSVHCKFEPSEHVDSFTLKISPVKF